MFRSTIFSRLFLFHVTLEKIFREFWIYFLQTVVLVHRRLTIFQRDVREREIEMRLTIIRLQPDRFLKRRRRFLVSPGPEIDRAEIVLCLGIARLERESFLVRVDRGLELLVLVKRRAETVVSICVIALESNSLLKLGARFFESSDVVERRAEIVVRFRKIRLRTSGARQHA